MAGNISIYDKMFKYQDSYEVDVLLSGVVLKEDVGPYKVGEEFDLIAISFERSIIEFYQKGDRRSFDLHINTG